MLQDSQPEPAKTLTSYDRIYGGTMHLGFMISRSVDKVDI